MFGNSPGLPEALGQPQGRKELSDAEIDVEFGRQPAVGPGGAAVRVMLFLALSSAFAASRHQC